MGISINTNVASSRASNYLAANHANLQKSLDRLSSGRRITQPADDAGGLAVSMKLEHTGKVLRATTHNIANAVSLLQTQDGVLKSIGDIVSRMGELRAMHADVTKNTTDKQNYDSEFRDLAGQIAQLRTTKFNDKALFDTANGLNVVLDEFGTNVFTIDQALVKSVLNAATSADISSTFAGALATTASVAGNTYQHYTDALEAIATLRATNGGQVRRLNYQLANVETQITNLSAANGRIMDVDIAQESANLARQQVLVQASAAMTAQANMSNDVALMLLQ
jgi:flagellin